MVDCGSGLMHLIIFPDNTVMLYDCNLLEENKDGILRLLHEVIPCKNVNGKTKQSIDIFVNSHRDTDHLRGLKYINEEFAIKSIWDSGQSGESPEDSDYQYFMNLKNRLKNESTDNLVVPTPSDIAFRSFGKADVYILCDAKDFLQKDENCVLYESADRDQHTNCLVMLITFSERKILLTGDSDWKSWRDNIVPNFENAQVNYENTDILIASHHGSKTFFTNKEEINEEEYPDDTYTKSIELINPKITLISCGDYSQYHHPNTDAMELYKKYTSNKQVYTTHICGTFCGLISVDGDFAVVPRRFFNCSRNNHRELRLICRTDKGCSVESGDSVRTGCKLKFSLIGLGKVLAGAKVDEEWEVCNSGIYDDDNHHEIYFKENEGEDGRNHFSRDLAYKGTHLLRCCVVNRSQNFCQQLIFIVHGI